MSCNLRQDFEKRKPNILTLIVARAGRRILYETTDTEGALFLKSLKRYLDDAKQKYGLTRNDQLAQKLSVPHNHVSHWYHGTCYPGDEGMVKLARLLKVDPIEIIACVNYHKAARSIRRELYPNRNEALRKFWWQVYNQTARKR